MASGLNVRKFEFQNVASGKIYEVVLRQATNGAVTGRGVLLGTNKYNSDPITGNTTVALVVLTSALANVFGVAAKTDPFLVAAAIYDASNPAGAGAELGTLLV